MSAIQHLSENTPETVDELEETLFVQKIKESWISLPCNLSEQNIIPEKYRERVSNITTLLYYILEEEGYIERSNKENERILEAIKQTRIA